MATMTIGIESLLLDPQNPRHVPVTGQNEAIQAIIAEQGPKLTQLARHISEHGLNPLDRVLVFKSGKNYVVLEGNRRIAALKLLHKPSLADGTPIANEIRKIAAQNSRAPRDVECSVIGSREAAKPWLVIRHSGEQEGRGVVPWNAVASARFSAAPGSREARWIAFVDAAQAAFPGNPSIQEAIDTITSGRITTLGRLYSDPDFRDQLGIEDEDGVVRSHYPASEIEPVLERVLRDLAGDLSVTRIKSKEQRTKYLAGLPKPKKSAYVAQAQPLAATTSSAVTTRARSVRRTTRLGSPFKDLELRNLDQRIDNIVRELRKLDIDKFPNAAAVLARVLLELSLDQFITKKKLAISKQNPKLKDKLKRCLRELDPTNRDPVYQGVRAGLADSTSIFAISTLHGYVHNTNFHPTPTDVRAIVGNLKPFLQAMNDAI